MGSTWFYVRKPPKAASVGAVGEGVSVVGVRMGKVKLSGTGVPDRIDNVPLKHTDPFCAERCHHNLRV